MNIPIITLEVQGMKHAIKAALTNEAAAMDKAVQDALDRLCSEDNINQIVQEEARTAIEATLKEEVRNFFNWSSAGRRAVREAVHERLERMYPTQAHIDRKNRQEK